MTKALTATARTTLGISLVATPECEPQREHFAIRHQPLPEPQIGQLAIRTVMLSVDPYLVMRIRAGAFEAGRITSRIIARVEESKAEGFQEGDLVLGFGHWQERDCVNACDIRLLRPVAPLAAYLGIAGHSGFTAMLGTELLEIEPGHTVVVSSAAGMVGLVACQLARAAGARVVAIAGKQKARRIAAEYGLSAGIDYTAPDFVEQLAKVCPNGVDGHFENVGARILDPVLTLANPGARVALCGLLQHYNDDQPITLTHFRQILTKSISILPFSIYRHASAYPAALQRLEQMVMDGELRAMETIHYGIEAAPDAFLAMLAGDGIGKHLVKIAD